MIGNEAVPGMLVVVMVVVVVVHNANIQTINLPQQRSSLGTTVPCYVPMHIEHGKKPARLGSWRRGAVIGKRERERERERDPC